MIGRHDADLGARAHAIVRLAPGQPSQDLVSDREAWLEGKLARYKVPRTFEITDEELRDHAGKARRPDLRSRRL